MEKPDTLKLFETYAISKGYEASYTDDVVMLNNVTNPGNNFRISKSDDYYHVSTVKISFADYEYTAKCMVYLLLAEFNKDTSPDREHYMNFKVDL